MSFQDDIPAPEVAGVPLLLRLGGLHLRSLGSPGCEIAPCPGPVAVPGCPAWLLGMVVHKGEALPLVDLATALDDAGAAPRGDSRHMLVNRSGGVSLAFLVDAVDADDGREDAAQLDLDALSRNLLARSAGWVGP